MRKVWMILAFLALFMLISTASAVSFTSCDNGNQIVITYVNSSADYNDIFGFADPVNGDTDLGMIHSVTPPHEYYPIGAYEPGSYVSVYVKDPYNHIYRPWTPSGDGVLEPYHTKALQQPDGSWTIGFEDVWGGGDLDYNDVFLNVACKAVPTQPQDPTPTLTQDPTPTLPQDPTPTPEFPTLALPAAFITGLLGVVLFIKRTKEE